jgi:hypothetical protein
MAWHPLIRIEHLSEQEWFPMATLPIERALAYLDALEADRKAALALSEQKAEEAKLIQARQEGFRAALDILRGETSARDPVSGKDREPSADRRGDGERASGPQEPRRRRGRRLIPQLILRELSFSGQAMTSAQIARAIEYLPDRTETALERMESTGRVLRNKEGRWAIVITKTNGHAATAGNGNPLDAPQRAPQVLQDQGC